MAPDDGPRTATRGGFLHIRQSVALTRFKEGADSTLAARAILSDAFTMVMFRRPPIESPFLYGEEAAEYLRLSGRTLEYYRIHGGGPPYRKHGNRVLYHRSDLDAWSQGRKYHSTGSGKESGAR